MYEDNRTVDEVLTMAEEMPERLGLAAEMAEIRGSARGEGVSVTVDVHGKVVDLGITDRGLALGPERLAAEISRLTAQASRVAFRDGLLAVQAFCGPEFADAVMDQLDIDNIDWATPDEFHEPAEPAQPAAPPARERPAARGRHAPVVDKDESEGFVLRPV